MLSDKAGRIAFLISFAGHCLFLGAPAFSLRLPDQEKKSDEIAINIEIERPALLPKIDVIGQEKKIKETAEKPYKSESSPQLQPEEIAMKNTLKEPVEENIKVSDLAHEAMLRYQDMVKQRIEEARRYPLWAKRQGIEGAARLSFMVLPNGLSRDVAIIRSSGFEILDDEAVATIKRAGPFPLFPKEISCSSIHIETSIVFTLK